MNQKNNKENIFSFPNPEELICSVDSYYSNHLTMRIRIHRPNSEEKHLASFLMVRYFSGPTKWTSANFQLCDWREAAELYSELRENENSNIDIDALKEISEKHFHLYKVFSINPKMEIKIFAGSADLLTE